jgi:hypothetical protein
MCHGKAQNVPFYGTKRLLYLNDLRMKMPTTTTTTKQSLEPVELRSRLKISISIGININISIKLIRDHHELEDTTSKGQKIISQK